MDTPAALWLLASLAGFHRRPFDAELVIRRFPPPFDLPTLIEALEALGLKAGLATWPNEGQAALPLPAVALLAAPPASHSAAHPPPTLTPALIVRHGEDTLAWVKPGQTAPETLKPEAARAQATSALLLVAPAEPLASETASSGDKPDTSLPRKPFGFSWFVPELLRHKRIWRDVLLASLSIQLVGLATPLFTQVIIDKVIAHHSESTLIVLGVALVVFMLFTSSMTWLRQYLVLHTGSRIDAVLGEKVLTHLLHLPLPYFEARPTGTLVARLHGVEQLREFISGAAVSLVLDMPFLLIFLAVMFSYSWQLTLIALGITALIVVASLFMVPVFRERLDKQFLLGARNQAFLTEYLAGMATVKSLQLEPDVGRRYGTYLAQYLSAGFATKQVGNTYNVVANGLEQVMTLSILIAGAWLVMQPDAGMAGVLAQFQNATTRAEQKALLDQLITAWADTADMAQSLEARAAGKYRIQYEAFGNERRSSNIDTAAFAAVSSSSVGGNGGDAALLTDAGGLCLSERYRNLIADWSRKLHVLEAFNGQYFFNLPTQKSQTDGANWGLSVLAGSGVAGVAGLPTLRVNFSQAQLNLLQQAYESLKESVYASLVMQTRLKPYLDQIELVIDHSGLRLDATQLNQVFAEKRIQDPAAALFDLLELDRYASAFLTGTNWSGLADFDTLVETMPKTPSLAVLLDEFKVLTLTDGGDRRGLTNDTDIVLAGDGKDTLYGNNDNDRLFGQGGDDTLHGGKGDDMLSGGIGNDILYGAEGSDNLDAGAGDDVVVFNHGDDKDTLLAGEGTDTLSFGATVTPAMLSAALDRDGRVVLLVDEGAGGSITLDGARIDDLPGDLERLQFIDADGKARVFDWGAWLQAHGGALLSATTDAPLAFDGTGFELTGTVAPAGGLEAVAYAQSGDLFASAHLAHNTPTEGDDVLYGTPNGDALDAGAGNDMALGLAGNDTIQGGDGHDTIQGGDGDDVLEGNAGNDVVYGGWGADQLTGGTGHDQLFGEWGGDTYVYLPGQGEVVIDDDHRVLNRPGTGDGNGGLEGSDGNEWSDENSDASVDGAPNTLSFGPGIRPEDLRYSQQNGDLVIEFANHPGDRVILRGYEPNRATQTRSVDIVRFADGTEIVAESIEPTGITAMAPNEGGELMGTAFADTLMGGDGDDTLDGQGGADRLAGGAGSDTYLIHKSPGEPPVQTLIAETLRPQDRNRIELTGHVYPDALRLEFDGQDLLLRLNGIGDAIRFVNFDPRLSGMQAPVAEIALPDWGMTLSFDDLLASGLHITAQPDSDVLNGSPLADWLDGYEAKGAMSGGEGGDLYLIEADDGTDTIFDTESGDAPNTLVLPNGTLPEDVRLSHDQAGFLVLDLAGSDNRIRLSGFDPQNPLGPRAVERFRFGLRGNEIGYEELLARGFDIVGTDESDALKGTALTDRVRGGDGNDRIDATPGGDWLAGEGGHDTYVVHRGDGIVTIDDVAEQGAGNVLRFGPAIGSNDLSNKLRFEADGNGGHVLLIPYGDAGDLVRLTGFDPQDALGHHAIERFEFADGTAVDYATLVSWGFVVEGDNANNALKGTNVGDRLYGHGGDDVLQAGAGSDELHGGAGSDLLQGAEGDDAYVFNKGDGLDTIVDSGATDFNYIRFGTDIRPEDIRHEWDGTTLVLHYSPDDAVRIDNFRGTDGKPVILALAFADGTVVSLTEQINRAPVALQQLGDTVATEDQDFSLTLPAHLFSDPDTSDEVKVVVKLANGKPLPAWLRFDPVSRTLSGRPANDDVGVLAIAVEGQDHFGASARIGFRIGVQNTADAPEVGTPLSDLHTLEDCAFSFTLPADSFRDVDVGDVLSYSATQADGSALPTWLRFNAATRTFSGTPANADVGSVSVRVTAADMAGAQASQTFAIGVANVNDAPEVGTLLTNQTGRAGTALRWQLPATAFVDVDAGDALSYSATLSDGSALPAWLAFDAATGTFSGTPPAAGHLALRVTATDQAGAQASQRFSLAVEAGSNQAPITAADAATLTEDRQRLAWGNVLTNDRDPEGQPLCVADAGIRRGEYGVLNLLSNGSYTYALDNCSSKVQGLGAGETVTETFRYLASDGTQRSNGALTVTVQGTNDTPTLAKPLADVQLAKKKAFTWRVPAGSFVDIDRNDTLHYTATLANGKPLPNWLTFDAATQTFSGTAPSKTKDSIEVRITVSDGHGDCSYVSDSFKIKIGGKTQSSHSSEDRDEEKEKEKKSDQECDADAWQTGPDASPHDGASRPPERSRHDDLLQRFVDDYLRPGEDSTAPPSSLDRQCLTPWSDQEHTPESGHRADSGQEMARRWAELTQALSQLDADRQGAAAWQHSDQGADLSGLTAWTHRTSRSEQGGVDSVSLGSVSGTPLVGLRGLREGLTPLTW